MPTIAVGSTCPVLEAVMLGYLLATCEVMITSRYRTSGCDGNVCKWASEGYQRGNYKRNS